MKRRIAGSSTKQIEWNRPKIGVSQVISVKSDGILWHNGVSRQSLVPLPRQIPFHAPARD
jgi:repressor of nif and glnA expression